VLSGDGILQLRNDLRERAFYFAYEREAAAAIDWAPCVEPSRCPSLAPESRVDLAYATIGGYQPGKREALVWWWVAVGPPDQAVPGPIHHVVVGLD
jgi:hypothetical protein